MAALVGFFCLTATLSAETIFLEFNKNCTDRYEYTLTKDGVEQPYTSYHYKIKNRRVVLNVGTEADNTVPKMPAGTMTCNTSVINEAMARAVNDGSTEIFMVRKLPIGFNVTKVKSANVLTTEGNSVTFFNDEADYRVAEGSAVATQKDGGTAAVDTDGRRACFSTIELQSAVPTPDGVVSLTMIPELGVVEERGATESAYLRRLVKVNGVPFGQYLTSVCKGENPASYSQKDLRVVRGGAAAPVSAPVATTPAPAAPRASAPAAYSIPSEATAAADQMRSKGTAQVNPCDLPQQVGFHKVGAGETLYGISRKYGLSVADLKAWNGMSTNTITPCDQLKISAPVSRTASMADIPVRARTTTPATMSTESEQLATRGTPAPAPAPVVAAPAPKAAPTVPAKPTPAPTLPAWTTTADYYTATATDNVAALAERYGYTEARFRWMNGMGPTDVLKGGQLVRIRDCDGQSNSAPLPKSYEDKSGRYNDVFSNKGASATPTPNSAPTAPQTYSSTPAPVAAAPVTVPAKPRRVHVVVPGESLYRIARTYNMTTDELRALNNMDKGELILPEQVLYVE